MDFAVYIQWCKDSKDFTAYKGHDHAVDTYWNIMQVKLL